MLRRLYDYTLNLANHPRAGLALFLIAFIESSIFPIPPDVMLLPMCLAAPKRAFRYAAICTAGSVLGGVLGYIIGYGFFASIGQPILEFYGKVDSFEHFKALYNQWGGWIVFGAGLTPFPYKVITITSGLVNMNIGLFIIASVIGRALRFYLVAALLWKWGAPIKLLIDRHFATITTLFFILLVGGFVAIKFLL